MKLSKFLEDAKGRHVHIGSGTAFFFMDVVDDSTPNTIDRISNEYYYDLPEKIKARKGRLERLPELIKSAKARYKELPKIIKEQRKVVENALKVYEISRNADDELAKREAKEVYEKENKALERLTEERKRIPLRIESYKKERDRLPALIDKLTENYKTFVPFADREVVDSYPSFLNDAVCCIIEGDEAGRFWFEKEYKNPELLKQYEEDDE